MSQFHKPALIIFTVIYGLFTIYRLYQVLSGNFIRRPTISESALSVRAILDCWIFMALWFIL